MTSTPSAQLGSVCPELIERADRVLDPVPEAGGDPVLADLRIANVGRALVDGLGARAELGALVGELLTTRRERA